MGRAIPSKKRWKTWNRFQIPILIFCNDLKDPNKPSSGPQLRHAHNE